MLSQTSVTGAHHVHCAQTQATHPATLCLCRLPAQQSNHGCPAAHCRELHTPTRPTRPSSIAPRLCDHGRACRPLLGFATSGLFRAARQPPCPCRWRGCSSSGTSRRSERCGRTSPPAMAERPASFLSNAPWGWTGIAVHSTPAAHAQEERTCAPTTQTPAPPPPPLARTGVPQRGHAPAARRRARRLRSAHAGTQIRSRPHQAGRPIHQRPVNGRGDQRHAGCARRSQPRRPQRRPGRPACALPCCAVPSCASRRRAGRTIAAARMRCCVRAARGGCAHAGGAVGAHRVDLRAGTEGVVGLVVLCRVLVLVLVEQHGRLMQQAEHGACRSLQYFRRPLFVGMPQFLFFDTWLF